MLHSRSSAACEENELLQDACKQGRQTKSNAYYTAHVVQGIDPPTELDEQQKSAWLKDKHFLQQLIDSSKVRHMSTRLRKLLGM